MSNGYFIWIFFCQRMEILRAFSQTPVSKGTRDRTKQIGIFSLINSATLIYGTTFPGTTKVHSTSPAGCFSLLKNVLHLYLYKNGAPNFN